MTPSEILKNEEAKITQRTGRYIPPYRIAAMMGWAILAATGEGE
jgi:hypothetical protein